MTGDCVSTRRCLERLGCAFETWDSGHRRERLGPSRVPRAAPSRSTRRTRAPRTRLLAGSSPGSPLFAVLTGDESLLGRPMGRVVEPLREMGARIEGREGGKFAPLCFLPGHREPAAPFLVPPRAQRPGEELPPPRGPARGRAFPGSAGRSSRATTRSGCCGRWACASTWRDPAIARFPRLRAPAFRDRGTRRCLVRRIFHCRRAHFRAGAFGERVRHQSDPDRLPQCRATHGRTAWNPGGGLVSRGARRHAPASPRLPARARLSRRRRFPSSSMRSPFSRFSDSLPAGSPWCAARRSCASRRATGSR